MMGFGQARGALGENGVGRVDKGKAFNNVPYDLRDFRAHDKLGGSEARFAESTRGRSMRISGEGGSRE